MDTQSIRVSNAEHAALPWRIGEIASDFALLDAWALPATGDRSEFRSLLAVFDKLDPAKDESSPASRWLFALRHRLGQRFGWDEHMNAWPIPGCRESSLRDRLPNDLPAMELLPSRPGPFRPVFCTDSEWVAELSNSTVHAALQLGWVLEGDRYRGRLGVYIKPRGWFGRLYMAGIAPFRHFIVYPAVLRRIGRAWCNRAHEDA